MAPRVEQLYRHALNTFSKKSSDVTPSFEENFSKLKQLAYQITAEDVKLEKCFEKKHKEENGWRFSPRKAPVTYVDMYEDDDFTMGIFIVRDGCRLPLHDHPGMHGILKVIYGTLNIQSYTLISEERKKELTASFNPNMLLAEKLPNAIVSETDNVCVLTPTVNNLHEIHAVDGPAAFLDILAPPYDSDIVPGVGKRECHYYAEMEQPNAREDAKEHSDKNYRWLIPISSPSDFWSDTASYQGPSLR